MKDKSIAQKITQMAFEITGAELNDEEELKESGLDSLSLVAVIAAMEEEFGISFSDDDLDPENLNTLADLVRITERYL